MQKKSIQQNIDFADSSFEYFKMDCNHDLVVYLNSWDAKLIRLTFKNPIQFCYAPGDFPANIYEIDESNLLEKALSDYYEKIPENTPFKLFQIEDIDDFPFIQVVAESVSIVKEYS